MKFRIPPLIIWSLISCLTVCTLTGCSGCTQTPPTPKQQAAQKKKKEEEEKKKKKAYEIKRLSTLPFSINHEADPKTINNFFKKGQFSTVSGVYASNKADFSGDLRIKNVAITESDKYVMSFSQPIILPKETPKAGENLLYIKESTKEFFKTRLELTPANSGIPIYSNEISSDNVLHPGENLLLILAEIPSKFSNLTQDEIIPEWSKSEKGFTDEQTYFALPIEANKSFDLPTNPLAWSHIAYVIWDNIDPNKVSIEHQMALVDWIHMGGQLIISGPVSMDKLRNSVIWNYLPAEPDGTVNVSHDQWSQLDSAWGATGSRTLSSEFSDARDWTCLDLIIREGANVTVDVEKDGKTYPLVVEKNLGLGRVAVSAFDLSATNFKKWIEFDNFFNAIILRRWAREFERSKEDRDTIIFKWLAPEGSLGIQNTPYLSNSFSLFSRGVRNQTKAYDPIMGEQSPTKITEQATWDDKSPASTTAREILAKTSTINIPSRGDIVFLMGVYLVLVVPLNWAVFKLIGRLEWAWFAVPVITIGVSVVYVFFTQTEIGFVRKRQEVAFLEVYNNYPRAHLTRYIGLYNSLATTYDLIFETANNSAVLFPFISPNERKSIGVTSLRYHRGADVRISNYGISSNSIGELHSEEISDMQGSIKVEIDGDGSITVSNQSSSIPLRNAVLLDLQEGTVFPIGDIAPAEKLNRKSKSTKLEQAIEKYSSVQDKDTLENIKVLYKLGVENQRGVERYRLLAWNDVVLPGLRVESEPGKSTAMNLVIVHVAPRKREAPQPDSPSRSQLN